MPTPVGVGNTNFRETGRNLTVNRTSVDNMTVTLKGRAALLSSSWASFQVGQPDSIYGSMYLESKSFTEEGPVGEISLNYVGISGSESEVEFENSISLQSVTITTDEDESVTFSYFGQSSTTRWISKSGSIPTSPGYPGQPPSQIPTEMLFKPVPPNYNGSIAGRYKASMRLSAFTRTSIAPGVWAVVETWETMIEPKE